MIMSRKLLLTALLACAFILVLSPASIHAQKPQQPVNIYFFWGEGCPHCEKEKPFLDQLEQRYPQVRVHAYEIWGNKQNRDLMIELGKKLDAVVSGVPFTVIGEQYVVGWMDERTSGAQIEDAVRCVLENGCRDVGSELSHSVTKTPDVGKAIPETLTLPFLGEVRTKNLSLPVFTLIVAALDGFNPCAMWTLIFLISLLLGMSNRKRMWTLGIAFIVTSAGVYFLFLAAWLNLLLFIGFILWVRLAIGLVALGGGGYYLREFFANPHGGCKVTGGEKRQKVFARMKEFAYNSNFLLALGGIILLAVAVNLVELICSAGLPAVYTQVLTLSRLPVWQYYLYLLLYIFIFMLDDLFVFFSAMITLQMTGLSDKYSRVSHLVGGTLMLLIGLLLIFKPEWLMFG
ncbi:hypothetical protein AUJ46_01445 [Candidatus Peregrinibacteria bacterium CG1_02_54_53]|nr:MAG: hypothetical protein AUJ46_01445 [Candidatus Peregrinibacteria bacterium CG1_02_54_53]